MPYDPQYAKRLHDYAQLHLGFTGDNAELAQLFNCSIRTIQYWISKYPDFREAVREVRQDPTQLVVAATLQRCLGYNYNETKTMPNGSKIVTTRHVPPSVQAQQFWLRNKDPQNWRADEIRVSGSLETQDPKLAILVDELLHKHPEIRSDVVTRLRAECSDAAPGTD